MTTPTTTTHRRTTVSSVEYVSAWVDSHATVTLSGQPVALLIQPHSVPPDVTPVWRTATWVGSPGNARAAQILVGPGTANVIPQGEYDVWAKVTDVPEVPVILCGRLTIY
jgi:hypothetical protein